MLMNYGLHPQRDAFSVNSLSQQRHEVNSSVVKEDSRPVNTFHLHLFLKIVLVC